MLHLPFLLFLSTLSIAGISRYSLFFYFEQTLCWMPLKSFQYGVLSSIPMIFQTLAIFLFIIFAWIYPKGKITQQAFLQRFLEILLFKSINIQNTIISYIGKTMSSSRSRKNYYEVLGLKTDATFADIEDSYKKLSHQWHPDRNKSNRREAEARFHQISQAYDVLSNRNRRAHYDEVNHWNFSNEDADRTFERFFQQHGMEDESEKKFFEQHFPERKRNYYDVLGVPRSASMEEIKKAYRSLALQYHPKNNPDNSQARRKFNEINEAYNALSTQARRSNYDIFSFGAIAPWRANDIFEDFWGDRFHELEEVDDFFKPVLRKKWSRNLDKWMNQGFDFGKIDNGQTQKTSTYYSNKNGVESKKSVSTKTKYEKGVPISQTTEEYQFPDGNKEVRIIKDDGKGNVTSKVYNLKKGENLPIEN